MRFRFFVLKKEKKENKKEWIIILCNNIEANEILS